MRPGHQPHLQFTTLCYRASHGLILTRTSVSHASCHLQSFSHRAGEPGSTLLLLHSDTDLRTFPRRPLGATMNAVKAEQLIIHHRFFSCPATRYTSSILRYDRFRKHHPNRTRDVRWSDSYPCNLEVTARRGRARIAKEGDEEAKAVWKTSSRDELLPKPRRRARPA